MTPFATGSYDKVSLAVLGPAEFNTKTGLFFETWKNHQINISKSDFEGEEKMVLTCL